MIFTFSRTLLLLSPWILGDLIQKSLTNYTSQFVLHLLQKEFTSRINPGSYYIQNQEKEDLLQLNQF